MASPGDLACASGVSVILVCAVLFILVIISAASAYDAGSWGSSCLLWPREQRFRAGWEPRDSALYCEVPSPLLFCTQSAWLTRVCACKDGAVAWLACHSRHLGYHRTWWGGRRCSQNWLLRPVFLLSCLFFSCWPSTIFRLLKISQFYSFVLITEPYSLYLPLPASFLIYLVCYFDQTRKFTDFLKASDPCLIF